MWADLRYSAAALRGAFRLPPRALQWSPVSGLGTSFSGIFLRLFLRFAILFCCHYVRLIILHHVMCFDPPETHDFEIANFHVLFHVSLLAACLSVSNYSFCGACCFSWPNEVFCKSKYVV